ncbi:guanine permease [Lactiplantibacillus fabifermentans]|uniref:Integral membrane protein n=2 Tax=Lactiplantibacillus fabifermentans TaxID=483011 RepID=A0A0R2NP34_9LACO|nr:guanine permease [Lactiplantibacillus fabifermentans]ETY73558.1 guanine permease [Lactiplantibacillus fabifermentans T30PCM01]KRO27447.1 integral membrane protein [Lactiplantibacillus fabifermentans DSM 21115]
MHWLADFLAAIGVVLNGIPQGIMAMGLGFAVFPTTFSFGLAAIVNGFTGSVAPISFQAESLALTGHLGRNLRERSSIICFGAVIMLAIGLTGSLSKIVAILGDQIMGGMMAGVGIMLAKLALQMTKESRRCGWLSIALAVVTYLVTKDLVWTIALSVIGTSLYAVFVEHYQQALPDHVTARKFQFIKPQFNLTVLRGALSLACLNIGANISYGLITGQMTGLKPNPVNLNLLTSTQALADFGTSLLGGAPVETIISATASAPEPVIAGIIMMVIMAIILFMGWLPKIGRFVPSSSIAGFLFILGAVVIFPENAATAMHGSASMIAGITLVVTAIADPFSGLMTGAILKFILPLIGLGV